MNCHEYYGNRQFAIQVKKTYDEICKKLTLKARSGNNKAALKLMEKMTEQNIVLYHLGFAIGDTGRIRKR